MTETTHCQAHTGQEERINALDGKINLVLWLLGILIVVMLSGIGAIYGCIQGMNSTIMGINSKFSLIDAKLTILEATDQRTAERLEKLERK